MTGDPLLYGPDGRPLVTRSDPGRLGADPNVTEAARVRQRPAYGRRSDLTRALVYGDEQIPEADRSPAQRGLLFWIRAGNYPEIAARIVGISRTSYYDWAKAGREANDCRTVACAHAHHGPTATDMTYGEFADAVEAAVAESEGRAVGYVRAQMPRSANAAIDWLARRFPARWRETARLEHTGAEGGPIETTTTSDAKKKLLERTDEIVSRLAADYPPPS